MDWKICDRQSFKVEDRYIYSTISFFKQ